MKTKTNYQLSKIEIKPITGPWWNLTQFQKGYKSAHTYYVEVIDTNLKHPAKWMFKIEEVSIGKAGMKIGVSPLHTPKGNVLLQLLSRRSIQSIRRKDRVSRNSYFAELWLHDITGKKNRLQVRECDINMRVAQNRKGIPQWIKENYLIDSSKYFIRTDMDKKTKRKSVCINIRKKNSHRQLIELFFASRVWVLQEKFFFREPSVGDPGYTDSID